MQPAATYSGDMLAGRRHARYGVFPLDAPMPGVNVRLDRDAGAGKRLEHGFMELSSPMNQKWFAIQIQNPHSWCQ
jgi:hypothetical protein